jgi:hypothetical protein
MDTIMLALYVKALNHRPPRIVTKQGHSSSIPSLPEIEFERMAAIRPTHCNAYNKLTQWRPKLAALIHPNYAQTLTLPMQLNMMVNKAFPFTPMGLVHVANKITVHSLPEQSDSLQLRTHFGRVYIHPKGWLFEVLTSASSSKFDQVPSAQIKATSYYLARAKHASGINISSEHEVPQWIVASANPEASQKSTRKQSKTLDFSASIGRQYAKVSGDYNPIHLHQVSAKLFGFKKAIAHGMYSKALAISSIAKHDDFYTSRFEIDTVFKQAISLPSQAMLSHFATGSNKCDFSLTSMSSQKERTFLQGSIR